MGDKLSSGRTLPPPPNRPARSSTQTPLRVAQDGHTLASLLARLGVAEDDIVRSLVANVPVEVLVELGARGATNRVVREGTRIVAEAVDFLAVATEAQLAQMPGVTEQLMASIVTAMERASTHQGALDAMKAAARVRRASSTASLASTMSKARGRREVLHQAASMLAAGGSDVQARLDTAKGTSENAAEVADGLEALVPIARELLQSAAQRRVQTRLTEAFPDETLRIAEEVRDAGLGAAARAERAGVMQGTINWWDGAALWLLRDLVDAFDAARKADPTIPKVQLLSLRVMLGRKRGAKKPRPAAPPSPPAPPTH